MKISWFFISSLTLSITTLFQAFIFLKFGYKKVHKTWIFFNLSVFVWAIGATLTCLYPSLGMIFWKQVALAGVSFSSTFFLHTVYLLTKSKFKAPLVLAYVQSFTFTLLAFSTELIHTQPKDYHGYLLPSASYLYPLWFVFWLVTFAYAHVYLAKFYLTESKQEDKQKYAFLFFAVLLGSSCAVFDFLYAWNFPYFPFANFGIAIYLLIANYAIFRYQIMDIEIVYKKGLLYSILIAILTAIYLLLIMLVEGLFRGMLGYKSLFVSLSAAFIIALLFNPLRSSIQKFLDYRFFKGTLESLTLEHERLKNELFHTEKLAYVGKMASSIVHEIKNPLTAIKSFCEYMPQRHLDEQFRERFKDLIPAEIKRIEEAVSQLLDLAKPQAPYFREVNLASLINSTLNLLENNFKRASVLVKRVFPDDEVLIQADEGQLRQVFLNLFLNAIDAMSGGGSLTVTLSKENKHIQITVEDTGKGIKQEDLPKLFTPFFTTKPNGIGLGLAIVQEIIKNHGGKIEVESEVGRGTRFYLKLPMSLD